MPSLLDVRRTLAAGVAVAMASMLIAFAFIVSDSFATQITADARASMGDADVVVLPERGSELPEQLTEKLRQAPGVASVRPYFEDFAVIDKPGNSNDHAVVLDVPTLTSTTYLAAGRLPQGPGEVAVSDGLSQSQNLVVGDALALRSKGTVPKTMTIVGLLQTGPDATRLDPRESYVFADAAQRQALGLAPDPSVLYVSAENNTSSTDLLQAVTAPVKAAQSGAQVYTATELVPLRATNRDSTVAITLQVLKTIGPVCAVVAAIVIATTFTTLVARQTRQVGLLRCVGATRGQVRAAVLHAALSTGAIGAVAGATVGTGAAASLARTGVVEGLVPEYLTISRTSLALAVVVSILVTVVAVLRPAWRASRTSPLLALTGQVAEERVLGRGRRRAAGAGVVISILGAAVLGLAVKNRVIEYVAFGSAILILGVVLGMPLMVTLLSHLGSRTRQPILQLASRNLGRNTGRASATATALLVSVTTAAALFTGLASLNASLTNYLNAGYPIDIQVFGISADQDPAPIVAKASAVDGVEQVAAVPQLELALSTPTKEEELAVYSVDEAALAPLLRSHKDLDGLDDRTIVLGESHGLAEGESVTLTGPAGSATLKVRIQEGGFGALVTPTVAQQLSGDAPTAHSLWARTSGDGSDRATVDNLRQALRGTGLQVSGRAEALQSFKQSVTKVTWVITMIFTLSLVIALSGLVNTTDVTVLERVREIGVLRATGTSRGQIRQLFTTEAALIAVLSGGIGSLLGVGLGMAGITVAMGADGPLTLQVPWLALVGLLLGSGVIGMLAAMLPAGRAAAVAPATALAAD